VTWTHLFSPNKTIGEFRYGLGLRTTLVGIKAGNDTPIIRFAGTPVSASIIGNAGGFPINVIKPTINSSIIFRQLFSTIIFSKSVRTFAGQRSTI
jgi:hypothetical protein